MRAIGQWCWRAPAAVTSSTSCTSIMLKVVGRVNHAGPSRLPRRLVTTAGQGTTAVQPVRRIPHAHPVELGSSAVLGQPVKRLKVATAPRSSVYHRESLPADPAAASSPPKTATGAGGSPSCMTSPARIHLLRAHLLEEASQRKAFG